MCVKKYIKFFLLSDIRYPALHCQNPVETYQTSNFHHFHIHIFILDPFLSAPFLSAPDRWRVYNMIITCPLLFSPFFSFFAYHRLFLSSHWTTEDFQYFLIKKRDNHALQRKKKTTEKLFSSPLVVGCELYSTVTEGCQVGWKGE